MAGIRFVVVVFDALRPDMVDEAVMPALSRFLARASRFARSRAVFPSETRVNTASFATGSTPGRHGIVANAFFDPALPGEAPFDTGRGEMLARAATVYGPALVTATTLGEVLHAAGRRLVVVSAGTPGNARFLNPLAVQLGQATFSVHGPEWSSPAAEHAAVVERLGPVPPAEVPNLGRCRYAAEALIAHYLPRHRPDVAVLWLSEPDIAYHYRGIGSPESMAALRHVDGLFGRILAAVAAGPDGERTQIVVMSDHGQVATRGRVDLTAELVRAGFRVGTAAGPDIDAVLVPASSGNLFVRDGDAGRIRDIAGWLMEQPWCGLLFTAGGNGREGLVPGTFDAALAGTAHPRLPHIAFTLASDATANAHGLAGSCLIADDPVPPVGGGVHGGLNPVELATLLAAGGSGFRAGFVSELPAGIADVAPTILDALGIARPASMTGRVLAEALACGGEAGEAEAFDASVGHGRYRQRLRLARAGGAIYLDGGWRDP